MLTEDQLERLSLLSEAVSRDPEFIRKALREAKFDKDLPFVTADVATSCVLLVAHIDDATAEIIAAQGVGRVASGFASPREKEIQRRLDFIRDASLSDLVDIRRKALEKND